MNGKFPVSASSPARSMTLCQLTFSVFALFALLSISGQVTAQSSIDLNQTSRDGLHSTQDEAEKLEQKIKVLAKEIDVQKNLLERIDVAQENVVEREKKTKQAKKTHYKILNRTQKDIVKDFRDPKLFGGFNRSFKKMEKTGNKLQVVREKCFAGLAKTNKEYGQLRKRYIEAKTEFAFRQLVNEPTEDFEEKAESLGEQLKKFEESAAEKSRACLSAEKKRGQAHTEFVKEILPPLITLEIIQNKFPELEPPSMKPIFEHMEKLKEFNAEFAKIEFDAQVLKQRKKEIIKSNRKKNGLKRDLLKALQKIRNP